MFKKLIHIILVLLLSVALFSCVESEYHLDNIDTSGVIYIPPIPLGSFDKLIIKDLNSWIIEIPELPTVTVAFSHTFKDVFGPSSVKRFFHQYMERNVSIEGMLDMYVLGAGSNIDIDIDFYVLDADMKEIEEVEIQGLHDIKYGTHALLLEFLKEDGKYMTDAQHLQIKISMTTPESIVLREKDYIWLHNMIIKTSGYFVEL